MRRINFITTCILVFFTISLNGQTQKERKVVKLGSGTFELNSVNYTKMWGGKNNEIISITLPKNTIEWCYVFRTLKDGQTASASRLFDYVMSFDLTTSLGNMAIKALAGNGGTCNVYLKDAVFNGVHKYHIKYFQGEGIIEKNIFISNYYLYFENPHLTNKVIIEYEVIAIVEE